MSIKKKRSGFEERMGEVLERDGFLYEPYSIPYTISHKYTPDFTLGNVLVECKGWFRPGDRQKYKAIRDSLSEDMEFIFLLQSPLKKLSKGAELTMAGWCNKENLNWFSCPEALVDYVMSGDYP